jgi:hypothetical protein
MIRPEHGGRSGRRQGSAAAFLGFGDQWTVMPRQKCRLFPASIGHMETAGGADEIRTHDLCSAIAEVCNKRATGRYSHT